MSHQSVSENKASAEFFFSFNDYISDMLLLFCFVFFFSEALEARFFPRCKLLPLSYAQRSPPVNNFSRPVAKAEQHNSSLRALTPAVVA